MAKLPNDQPPVKKKPRSGRGGEPPYFPFYAADWLASGTVSAMSLAEQGAYIRLLCFSWREHGLPTDLEKVRKLTGLRGSAWGSLWKHAHVSFSESAWCTCGIDHGLRLRNPRQERERFILYGDRESLSERGKAGAAARWDASAIAQAMPKNASSSSSSYALEEKIAPTERADAPARNRSQVSIRPFSIGRPFPTAPTQAGAIDPETRLAQGVATKLIDRVRVLLAGRGNSFDPGAWWGKAAKENPTAPLEAKILALGELGKRLERGDPPDNYWAYLDTTLAEKMANFYADRAEDESKARRAPERKEASWA